VRGISRKNRTLSPRSAPLEKGEREVLKLLLLAIERCAAQAVVDLRVINIAQAAGQDQAIDQGLGLPQVHESIEVLDTGVVEGAPCREEPQKVKLRPIACLNQFDGFRLSRQNFLLHDGNANRRVAVLSESCCQLLLRRHLQSLN